MGSIDIGYKWYNFRIYLDENKIEILDRNYKTLKNVNVIFDSKIEKIIKDRDPEMIKFLEDILRNIKL